MADHHTWAMQAAENAIDVIPYIIVLREQIPVISASEMAARIEATFQDRAQWNQAVIESDLDRHVKIWLVVP